MTTLDASAESVPRVPAQHTAEAAPEAPPAADPMMIGLPSFVVGSVALGLVLIGYVPATAVGASLAVIIAATGLGLVIAAIWAAAVGQSAVAGVFAIFSGFWLSYALLVLGLTHNWFGIDATAAVATQGLFLISWLVIVGMLTLATLRLPVAYTLLFALIEVALVLVLVGTLQGSAGILQVGGYVVLVFAAVGVYLFFSSASTATGGSALPLGPPIMH
ncbi:MULTISPECIES: GPR1/FUN34/YaaH family transporter [unclassified Amycolatopsis]|uniref:GPR1/FUN34/YaaH family transporter n=1 Tax=unclassified Amycolatopsis TaxID=2618356 RepID=UPI001C6A0AB1|nr:GPR1/FUN34/YaaH family transporter [Amycolatopsis sp. DSM 110486]QYN20549.1 GPR1/FUN34/YaaH family transporter [Amycolatopsis sp. DSM 110486]